jgi:hypothetical protein
MRLYVGKHVVVYIRDAMKKKKKSNQQRRFIGHETEKLFKFISEFIIKRLVNVLRIGSGEKNKQKTGRERKSQLSGLAVDPSSDDDAQLLKAPR